VDWGVEKVKQEEEAVVAVVMVRCLRRECAVSELFLSLKARGALFSFFLFSWCAMAMCHSCISTHLLHGILEASCRKHRHMVCTYLASARI
jgi:hypothetical protein